MLDFFVILPFGRKRKNSEIFIFAPSEFSDFQKFAEVAKLRWRKKAA